MNLFLTFLFQIDYTADEWPHILHFQKNRESALSVGFTLCTTGSERSSFE